MRTVKLAMDLHSDELKKNYNANLLSVQVKIGYTIAKKRSTLSKALLSVLSNFQIVHNA